jgi:hypothetical protein
MTRLMMVIHSLAATTLALGLAVVVQAPGWETARFWRCRSAISWRGRAIDPHPDLGGGDPGAARGGR